MDALLNIAIDAARTASKIILNGIQKLDSLTINEKTKNDFVSEIDVMAEKSIIETIHKAYPNHGIIAEESGETPGDETNWIIDPLDGTNNYLHGYPHFAISIAVMQKDRIEHGVVYDPIRHDLFTASRGGGARLNSRRIRVSKKSKLDHTLLGTGFPSRYPELQEPYLKSFAKMMAQTAGIRRGGAAALDLAYVAANYLDGFWECNLKPWDMAAGVLLIKEAGGLVTDLLGGEDYLKNGHIIAANPKIIKQLHQNTRDLANYFKQKHETAD